MTITKIKKMLAATFAGITAPEMAADFYGYLCAIETLAKEYKSEVKSYLGEFAAAEKDNKLTVSGNFYQVTYYLRNGEDYKGIAEKHAPDVKPVTWKDIVMSNVTLSPQLLAAYKVVTPSVKCSAKSAA